jgi:hypothetical protein
MKIILEIVANVFYKYYAKGSTYSIAYFKSLISTSFLIFFSIVIILKISNIDLNIFIFFPKESGKFLRLISGLFLVLPFYVGLSLILNKDKVENLELTKKTRMIANALLPSYIILIFFLFLLVVKVI